MSAAEKGDCSERHACGWRGPSWLHVAGLCGTCKGWALRYADGTVAADGLPRCQHRRCVKYRAADSAHPGGES